MRKVVCPLILDLLQINKISPAELKVIFACIARNGFQIGNCNSGIIAARSRLSMPTVNRAIDNLIIKGIFIKNSVRGQARMGRIHLPEIENKYSSALLLEQHYEEYEGVLVISDLYSNSLILKTANNKKVKIIIKNSMKSVFRIPVGLNIRVKCLPIELVEDTEIVDLVKSHNIPAFYLSNNIEILS